MQKKLKMLYDLYYIPCLVLHVSWLLAPAIVCYSRLLLIDHPGISPLPDNNLESTSYVSAFPKSLLLAKSISFEIDNIKITFSKYM